MDWVVFASCFVAVITLIIDIIKSAKDKKSLSSEHISLKEDNQLLKETMRDSKDYLSKEHSNIYRQNEKIQDIVTNIDKQIYAEIEKSNIRYNNLSDSQKDIKKHIEAVNDLMNEVERLQTIVVKQKQELDMLYAEKPKYSLHTQTNNLTKTLN